MKHYLTPFLASVRIFIIYTLKIAGRRLSEAYNLRFTIAKADFFFFFFNRLLKDVRII